MRNSRYIEIDLLRTLAIVMMVIYHTLWDLEFLWGLHVGSMSTGGWLLARTTANFFLLLVGISFAISWSRKPIYKRVLKRSATILAGALVVTIGTYLIDPETYVRFGILHLIATATLLLPLVARLKEGNVALGIVTIASAAFFRGQYAQTPFLLPLGITYPGFQSVDYFPLFPWFGVILIGYAIGYFLYIRNLEWRNSLPLLHTSCFLLLSRPGKHALFLYLIHQPIIFAILWMVLGKPHI